MIKTKSLIKLTIISILASLILGACAPQKSEPVTLKLALLPVLDTLPIHVAAHEGYFEEQGLSIVLIPVSSAPERDSIVSAGEADGMLNEVVSTLFYNKSAYWDGSALIFSTACSTAARKPLIVSGLASMVSLRKDSTLKPNSGWLVSSMATVAPP